MTENDKKLIASLIPSPIFIALKKWVEERKDIIKSKPIKKENEFDTIYELGNSDGRYAELEELIRTLEDIYKRFIQK